MCLHPVIIIERIYCLCIVLVHSLFILGSPEFLVFELHCFDHISPVLKLLHLLLWLQHGNMLSSKSVFWHSVLSVVSPPTTYLAFASLFLFSPVLHHFSLLTEASCSALASKLVFFWKRSLSLSGPSPTSLPSLLECFGFISSSFKTEGKTHLFVIPLFEQAFVRFCRLKLSLLFERRFVRPTNRFTAVWRTVIPFVFLFIH